jgi:hypothetical protein
VSTWDFVAISNLFLLGLSYLEKGGRLGSPALLARAEEVAAAEAIAEREKKGAVPAGTAP